MRLSWWQQILFLIAAAGVFSMLFIIGDLIVYGGVKW